MRKFTKGLLMTFIASAVSLGSYAQDAPNGYYRVINAGYLDAKGTGVMNVTSPTTAQPQAKKADAITMPGTVLYIATEPIDPSLVVEPTPGLEYVDFTANDLLVNNLRSQAVDASAAVYGKMVETLRAGLSGSLSTLNTINKWGLTDDQKKEIIEEMFSYMQMYLEPTKTKAGEDAWYLKSTTPNTRPLVQALGGEYTEESLWEALLDGVKTFCDEKEQADLWLQWEAFFHYSLSNGANRIHMGHTYYLIGGRVDTNFNNHTQEMNTGNGDGTEFISFANNNTVDYPTSGYTPEIEVAGDYAKWIIEEIVPGTETKGSNYFGLDVVVKGNDGHYYGTLYVDFPMEIVDNGENTVKVYGIKEAPKVDKNWPSADPADAIAGYVVSEEITGTVPARTPVVIECMDKTHTKNFLQPVGNPVEEDVNKAIQDETDRSFLRGIFFPKSFEGSPDGPDPEDEFYYCIRPLNEDGTVNKGTPIARKLIRVFNEGKNKLNPLGFFKYNGSTMKANRAFMILDESMLDENNEANIALIDYETWLTLGINEVSTAKEENNTIYDIQGRIVNNPTKGLYIVNGKKMVIK